MHHRQRDVAEQAEPATAIAFGVVAWRPHERIGVPHRSIQGRLHGLQRSARGELCDLEAALAERSQCAGIADRTLPKEL